MAVAASDKDVKPVLVGGFEYQKICWSSEDGLPVPQ